MKDYKKTMFAFKRLQSYLMQIYLTMNLKAGNVLEIGNENGFVSNVLKQYCNLTTLDFREEFNPDLFIDITNLNQLDTLENNAYDLILICEVLEHIPYNEIDGILQILKKKTKKYIVISVPNTCAYFNLTFFHHGLDRLYSNTLKKIVSMFSIKIGKVLSKLDYNFRKKHKKFAFQGYNLDLHKYPRHHWELGIDKYSTKTFKKLLNKSFTIVKEGRLREHPWHHFFILKKGE